LLILIWNKAIQKNNNVVSRISPLFLERRKVIKIVQNSAHNVDLWGQGQGCQMVYFQTKNLNLCKFGRVLQWRMLVHFMAIRSILRTLLYFMTIWYIFPRIGTFYGHLVYIPPYWNIFPRFDMLYQDLGTLDKANVVIFYQNTLSTGRSLRALWLWWRPFHRRTRARPSGWMNELCRDASEARPDFGLGPW
jgi:hypothetical protein